MKEGNLSLSFTHSQTHTPQLNCVESLTELNCQSMQWDKLNMQILCVNYFPITNLQPDA